MKRLKLATAHAAGDVRAITAKANDAGVFEIEYRDGFRAFVVIPNGWVHENEGSPFIFAGQRKGIDHSDVCQFYLRPPDPFALRAVDEGHRLAHQHRARSLPVKRRLLTTGILDAAMTSKFEKGKRIETPYLEIAYKPTEWGPATGEIPPARPQK